MFFFFFLRNINIRTFVLLRNNNIKYLLKNCEKAKNDFFIVLTEINTMAVSYVLCIEYL